MIDKQGLHSLTHRATEWEVSGRQRVEAKKPTCLSLNSDQLTDVTVGWGGRSEGESVKGSWRGRGETISSGKVELIWQLPLEMHYSVLVALLSLLL